MSERARQVFAHLAIAISQHEKSAGRSSLVVPAELLALRDIALSLATERQGATPIEPARVAGHDDGMATSDRLLMTKRDAAAALRVSVRTVERLIAAGELRAVTVGSSPRIRRVDLEEYVNGLDRPSDWRAGITTKEGA